MSELAPGSVSLDDDTPLSEIVEAPPPAEAPAPPPQQAAAPPPNPEDVEPEGTIVNPGGEKLVPLSALVAQRQEAARVKAEAAALREQTKEIDTIRAAWQAAQPAIEHARQQQRQAPPPPAPAGPLSEQEAIDYAKDLDLYKTDGTPDTARAQRLAARQEALADRKAQQYIAPFQQQTAQSQSAGNFEAVATWKDKSGAVVDRAILQDIWSKMPAELTAQPNVAAVMYRVALAETMLQGKHKAAIVPPPPAQHTESLGGAPAAREMSQLERNFISTVDMKPKDYEEISGRFKLGERNSLE